MNISQRCHADTCFPARPFEAIVCKQTVKRTIKLWKNAERKVSHAASPDGEVRMSDVAPPVKEVSAELANSEDVSASSRAIELTIRGLKDDGCVQRVTEALREVEYVVGTDGRDALSNGLIVVAAEPQAVVRDLMEAVRKLEGGYRAAPYQEKQWVWQGHKVNYSVAGKRKQRNSPPVVAVHGFGGNCHHWRKTTADLCDEFQVYAPDLLGFGASAKPSELVYDPHLWFKQVVAFVEEVVQEPCVVVGNSIGSQVCMYVASERPDLVRGMCLLNCVGGMNQRGLYKDSVQLLLMRPMFELFEFLLKKKNIANYLFSKFSDRGRVEQLLKARGSPYANPDAVHAELVDIFVEPSLDAGAVDVFVGVFTGEPGPRPEEMMKKVECPVLVAWGEADPWTPLNGSIGKFFTQQAKLKDNVDLVALPNTGHSPQDDRPELVAAALLPWLRRGMTPGNAEEIKQGISNAFA